MKTKQFYFREYNDAQMKVDLTDFSDGPLPLIWKWEGRYGLIPIEIIVNIIDHLSEVSTTNIELPTYTICTTAIVINIPEHIAKMLCTKQS